jgi:hypothetical protein
MIMPKNIEMVGIATFLSLPSNDKVTDSRPGTGSSSGSGARETRPVGSGALGRLFGGLSCWASSFGLRDQAPAKLRAPNRDSPATLKLNVVFRAVRISEHLLFPPAHLLQLTNGTLDKMALVTAIATKRGWVENRCHG